MAQFSRPTWAPSHTGTSSTLPFRRLFAHRLGVVSDVLADEARHEVEAVVVALLHAQPERMPNPFARDAQPLGAELRRQKLIRRSLINSRADRTTSTLPMHSKLKSTPPLVSSTITS